ncbi:MAG: NAD+ synthase [Armatimonadota bacterium]|jgi:NAD+ synthase
MPGLEIDCEQVRKIVTDFLRNEIAKAGFERAVVGMSGGLDSSLSAFIGAEALGAENLLGVFMPYSSSSPDSLTDAQTVADQLGIEAITVHITAMVDVYFEGFPRAGRIRRANKMARERMSILYDISALRRAIVLGTGNKSESLLGYTTLWGDMACGVNPIGDLYKTQVRQLARHMGVPERIVAKNPSADLWPGQTDEGELGFTYEEADKVLYALVDERRSAEDMIGAGFDDAFVKRVQDMVCGSQYKRRLPLVARIPPPRIDRDFRYARDRGR